MALLNFGLLLISFSEPVVSYRATHLEYKLMARLPSLNQIRCHIYHMRNKATILMVLFMLLSSCSTSRVYHSELPVVTIASEQVDLNDTGRVKKILNQQYANWRDVKYRLGGLSSSGIDCSGLVYRTFRERFGINVPRTTEYQSKTGKAIKKRELKSGDLVFFKTGITTRHVGIYIDNGYFLHVSSTRGVMKSSLKNPYWTSVYWQSRRL